MEVGLKRKYSREAKNFLDNAFAHLEQAKVLATNNEIRNKRFKDLEKDFQRIEHERRCKICWSQQSNTLFLPCLHCSTCLACDVQVESCPICRRRVQQRVKIYIA